MPAIIVFKYQIDEEVRKRTWIDTGIKPAADREYELDVEKVASNVRELLLVFSSDIDKTSIFPKRRYELSEFTAKDYGVSNTPMALLSEIKNDDELISHIMSHVASRAMATWHYNKKVEARKEAEALAEAERKAKVQARLDELDALSARKAAWIAEHGSERLRKAVKMNYDYGQMFEIEYVGAMYPMAGFAYNETEDTQFDPTLLALDLLEIMQGIATVTDPRIVWLNCEEWRVPFNPDWPTTTGSILGQPFEGNAIYFRDALVDRDIYLPVSPDTKEAYANKIQADQSPAGGEG